MIHSLKKLCGAGALLLPLSVWAQDSGSLYDQASTQQQTASGNLELFNQIQDQQRSINDLRGEIEELQHQVSQLQSDGQKQYLDLDNRVSTLEGNGDGQNQAPSANDANGNDGDSSTGGDASSTDSQTAAGGAAGTASNTASNDQQSYQQAYALVQQRQYPQAIEAFNAFNQQFPDSKLVGNAYYWLGEVYYSQSRIDDATKAFQTVISNYSSNIKVPDATYRLGMIKARKGDVDGSIKLLKSVTTKYPQSEAAKRSQAFLTKVGV